MGVNVDSVSLPPGSRFWLPSMDPHDGPSGRDDDGDGRATRGGGGGDGDGKGTSSTRSVPEPSELAWCVYSGRTGEPRHLDWLGAIKDEAVELEIAGVWWSLKERGHSSPVTLVTQVCIFTFPH